MRLVSYVDRGELRAGVLMGGLVIDARDALRALGEDTSGWAVREIVAFHPARQRLLAETSVQLLNAGGLRLTSRHTSPV